MLWCYYSHFQSGAHFIGFTLQLRNSIIIEHQASGGLWLCVLDDSDSRRCLWSSVSAPEVTYRSAASARIDLRVCVSAVKTLITHSETGRFEYNPNDELYV